MTRRIVYGTSLVVFLSTVAMTIASIVMPEWITWDTETDKALEPVHYTYGLHSRCSSLSNSCSPFPRWEDCQGPDRTFCSLWRTVGFLMSMSVALQLTALVAFTIPMLGGKQTRQHGWQVLSVIIALVVACQVVSMGIIAGVHDRDSRFYKGWMLGKSFVLCIASWVVLLFVDIGMIASAFLMEEEEGYELIPDRIPRDT